ncbi:MULTISPECIES: late competence development ComFB family protein [Ferrimonas]|uniref:late competence development ComFB family protein n=1 Tax=Ferrimonas TaxID=44011 RepID=UPI0003F51D31|nr:MULTISPECIES: late competence development ComFB family protein [Ferrimonas]USD36441.1 late competence development ComFB family protein [Ferrimonas sp. SCSIO 43195]
MDADIRNYYEILLEQTVTDRKLAEQYNDSQLADLFCLTLNQMPCRYFRHRVDLSAYASSDELVAMQKNVDEALTRALNYIERHPREE